MNEILLAFITGLTTGGLSCLAVQGGLLASSLAQQIEQELGEQGTGISGGASGGRDQVRGGKKAPAKAGRIHTALPIALFLLAKLAAYTLLGALLGLLGSFLTLNPTTRAILLLAIGVFMVGNALRMLNVHPIFRYFNLEPPKFITRYIRRTAKNAHGAAQKNYVSPLFLGALTVLIPCGVTQAMMAVALGTGNPLQSAALMFAFTLGTSPVFFLVAYLATQLGARLEAYFMRFVAVVVLVLGLVTFNSGLTLMGSPLAFNNLTSRLFASPAPAATQAPLLTDGVLELQVANNGYFPRTLYAPANQALQLALVTDQTTSCARDFVIPALGLNELLPKSGTVMVDIPAQPAGSELRFTCSMGMYSGKIVFEGG